jgi:hypothetical protein
MSLLTVLSIILILAVIGFILWLVETRIPMDATIKVVIEVIVVILVVIWLLQFLGVWGALGATKVGSILLGIA